MMLNTPQLYLFFAGIISVTLIDSIGALASRRLNFNYAWLIILSLLTYLLLGYFGSKHINPSTAITVSIFVGIYDATVGLWFSIKFNANINQSGDEPKSPGVFHLLVLMLIISVIFSTIGYALTQL